MKTNGRQIIQAISELESDITIFEREACTLRQENEKLRHVICALESELAKGAREYAALEAAHRPAPPMPGSQPSTLNPQLAAAASA